MNKEFRLIICYCLCFLFCITVAVAQKKVIVGYIKDKQSDEPIPFASAMLKKSRIGVLTDSTGKFILDVDKSDKESENSDDDA